MKKILKDLDEAISRAKPGTMDELIDFVHSFKGLENYGTHFKIVKHLGYLQGVRVFITGRKISHQLPLKNKVYSVFKGVDKYEQAGHTVINE